MSVRAGNDSLVGAKARLTGRQRRGSVTVGWRKFWIAGACAGPLVAACAHPPPPLHWTRLYVHQSGGGVHPFLRANVAGKPIILLLDTGTLRSILPRGFVRANNLLQESDAFTSSVVDAHGNRTDLPLVKNVPVQFEGEAGTGTLDFMVSPSEDVDNGILASQDILRSGGALVIDLGREELSYEQEAVALKRLGSEASSSLRAIEFHRCSAEGFFERAHRIVNANINGVSASMLIDTGASRTVLSRNNPALPGMLQLQGSVGTSRAVTSAGQTLVVGDVRVDFAQVSFVLPVMVSATSNKCWHGAIGADVLRHCTLVWGWSALWAVCRTPV
jgi:predicted aspartyl protease